MIPQPDIFWLLTGYHLSRLFNMINEWLRNTILSFILPLSVRLDHWLENTYPSLCRPRCRCCCNRFSPLVGKTMRSLTLTDIFQKFSIPISPFHVQVQNKVTGSYVLTESLEFWFWCLQTMEFLVLLLQTFADFGLIPLSNSSIGDGPLSLAI